MAFCEVAIAHYDVLYTFPAILQSFTHTMTIFPINSNYQIL